MSGMSKRGQVWWANLDPARGTEAGKIRPVVIVQTDLLNDAGHPSSIVCPITTKIARKASILRLHLAKGEVGNEEPSDVMVDQVRAIDNTRLTAQMGSLSTAKLLQLGENLKILLEL
jgi:mRNA interferase MazF